MALGTLGGLEPLSIVRYYVGSRRTPPPVEFRQPTSPPCACKQNGQLLGENEAVSCGKGKYVSLL